MKQHLWKLMAAAGLGLAAAPGARAQTFTPGNLVVSRSTYQDVGQAAGLTVGANLPDSKKPNSAGMTTPFQAVATGAYPTVFDNNQVDGSFGVTSAIFLDNVTTGGKVVSTLAVPTSQIVTSFPSKSELAVNFSTDNSAVTFMGYAAPVGALDISNSTTPGAPDPNNLDTAPPTYREVAQVNAAGTVQVTDTNAYSGNNGRAAILDDTNGQNVYFTVGNAANGGTPPAGGPVALGAGVQIVTPGQTPGAPVQAGSYSITQNGFASDKPSKDNNFRGETVFNNTLYVTKGSGGNGIDTLYQVGSAGSLPVAGNAAISILPGFPSSLVPGNTAPGQFYPFGLWFANQTTLYVADEGDGVMADAAKDPSAGLEKWSLNNGVWGLDYTLQTGLNLGAAYTVAGYPTGNDAATGLPYAPATDGLRNITGKINSDGTVSIFGVTSTVSGSGDQGADPNELVSITDLVSNTTAAQAATEQFTTLEGPVSGTVYRGVAFDTAAVPEPSPLALLALPLAGLCLLARRRKAA